MSSGLLVVVAVFILGILGGNQLIAIACAILFMVLLGDLRCVLTFLEQRALDIGLLFLLLAVLIPLARQRAPLGELVSSSLSFYGLVGIVSGIIAVCLNTRGLELLQDQPALIVGLVAGSLLGVTFLGGIPVGPLMGAGIASLFIAIYKYLVGGD
ncbi:MAG: DUF441 family protein [Clostridia bacterium]|nr:DUF441 family protein [Clostridia bacterium]